MKSKRKCAEVQVAAGLDQTHLNVKRKKKKSEYACYDNNRNKVLSDIQLLVIKVCSNIIITEILSRSQVTGAQFAFLTPQVL